MRRFAAALLGLVLLLSGLCALPVSAAGEPEGTVLYHRTASAKLAENRAAWPANSDYSWMHTCTAWSQGLLQQMSWYNNRNSQGRGLPVGETMSIEIPASIPTAGYAEISLSLQYATCEANSDIFMGNAGLLEVYASTDGGQTWSEGHATLRSHRLVDFGTTSNHLEAMIYQLDTTDIGCLVEEGAVIDRLRLRPYGSFPVHYGATRIHWIDVTGYESPRQAGGEGPGSAAAPIPVPEETLRRIVVEHMYRLIDVPWVTDGEFVTYNSNGYLDEGHTQYYKPGRLYLGPSYTRPTHTTWEMFTSVIDSQGNYLGPQELNKAWGMDCIRIVSSALTTVSNARHDTWTCIMFEPSLKLLAGVTNEGMLGDSDAVITANGDQAILRGYAAMEPGDFALHQNTSASGGITEHIRLETLPPKVVYEADGVTIDAQKSVAYMSETGGYIIYYWEKPDGTVVASTNKDPDAYQAAHPDYTYLYGTSCRKDKAFTFAELLSARYLAYTLEEYEQEQVHGVAVDAALYAGPETVREEGFACVLSSNWRLAVIRAALADARTGEEIWSEELCKPAESFQTLYRSDGLDEALAGLGQGRYALTVDVTGGPVTEVLGSPPVTRAVEMALTVGTPGDLTGDGKVNGKDVVLLRRYLAGGYGVELN